ncbi:MAG: hypothetical protein A2095_14300 [Sphingomonadales bacterium GWF1_63_6]|nr:MAG: hypothetical protein A2095_14300 [Sphingomonadales bacterium GWF1_63_6]
MRSQMPPQTTCSAEQGIDLSKVARASAFLADLTTNEQPRMAALVILPWQGRWQGEALTEGCPALDRVTPLHHFVVPYNRATCLC